jgi:hypothetical protein
VQIGGLSQGHVVAMQVLYDGGLGAGWEMKLAVIGTRLVRRRGCYVAVQQVRRAVEQPCFYYS